MMQSNRKKLIINYANVSAELMEVIRSKYPLGWINHTIKVPTANGNFFYAITVDTNEISYLIKVPVKVDTKNDTEKEDEFFNSLIEMKEPDEKDEEEDDKDKEKEKDQDE